MKEALKAGLAAFAIACGVPDGSSNPNRGACGDCKKQERPGESIGEIPNDRSLAETLEKIRKKALKDLNNIDPSMIRDPANRPMIHPGQ